MCPFEKKEKYFFYTNNFFFQEQKNFFFALQYKKTEQKVFLGQIFFVPEKKLVV